MEQYRKPYIHLKQNKYSILSSIIRWHEPEKPKDQKKIKFKNKQFNTNFKVPLAYTAPKLQKAINSLSK